MANYYLGLGANLGDRATMLASACQAISDLETTQIRAESTVYETPAWGYTDQPSFYNQCVHIETGLAPHRLLAQCQRIERALGRKRGEKWGPRLIDIDLIAWDGPPVETDDLNLPHKYAHERGFVLMPLNEIAPDLVLRKHKIGFHLSRLHIEELTQIKPIIE